MKKIVIFLMAAFLVFSMNSFAQEPAPKTTKKATTTQTKKKDAKADTKTTKAEPKADAKTTKAEPKADVKKDAAKPEAAKPASTDKVIAGQKGPDGQPVYEGAKGGQYYVNKSGNKTYLKAEDKAAGKKGPEGQPVYVGPKGGEYYINKNGNKTYLKPDKK